jgi:peptidoglycan/LPS O-acetylase OafA/YrhL
VSTPAVAVAVYLYSISIDLIVWRSIVWGVPAALIVGTVALSRVDFGRARILAPLVVLGDASYALYLVHPLVPMALQLIHFERIINPVENGYLFAAISVIPPVVAAFLLNAMDRRFRLMVLATIKIRPAPSVGAAPVLEKA